MNKRQYEGAKTIIDNWIMAKNGENLTVLTDEKHVDEAMCIKKAGEEAGAKVVTVVINSQQPQKGEPGSIETCAFMSADAIIAATHYSVTTTNLKKMAIENGARFLSLPLANNDGVSLLEREFMKANLDDVEKISSNAKQLLNEGTIIDVTTKAGTSLTMDVKGRPCGIFSGKCRESGQSGSASFELYIAPNEMKTNGKIVLDASLGYLGKVNVPFEMNIKEGKIISIQENEDGKRLKAYLDSFGDERMNVAGEFGIGLNPLAICSGSSYIEDESTLGTFHIGFGRNIAFGGENDAKGHFDLVMNEPTIKVDGKLIIKNGKFVV